MTRDLRISTYLHGQSTRKRNFGPKVVAAAAAAHLSGLQVNHPRGSQRHLEILLWFYDGVGLDWLQLCCSRRFWRIYGIQEKSVMSLMAGLVFGGLSAFGAYNITSDPKDIKVSLLSSGVLAVIMGMRYKNSGKLMPAGIMTGLSLLMVFRLLLLIV
ncbi:transmembrane protein 14A isoform X2 [Pelmatolapia mariae]|uniref:transmembrane protein 14A isoform X2 n=1 Tax=Pelmatolapia mariae TaxID=158779 RepID=UPI002FE5D1C4